MTDADFRLHREIVALARHRRLAEQHAHVMQQVRCHMVQAGFLPADYRASVVAEHAALVEAVAKGDAALAERLARNHNEAEVRLLVRTADAPVAGDVPG